MGKSLKKKYSLRNDVYDSLLRYFCFLLPSLTNLIFFSIQISHSSKKITVNVGIITSLRNSKELGHFFKNFLLRLGRMEDSSIASGK